jgi:hypothetical protein
MPHTWDEANVVVVNDLCDVFLDWFVIILLRIIALVFIKEIGQ